MLAAELMRTRAGRTTRFPLWTLRLGLLLSLAVLPAAQAVAQAGGAMLEDGTYIEHDAEGNVLDAFQEHLGFIAFGPFDDCHCAFGHYHGVLFNKDDPDPDGCGHGCIYPTDDTLGDLLRKLDRLSKRATKDRDLRKKFGMAATALENSAAAGCFEIADGILKGVGAMIAGAAENDLIKKRKRLNALIKGWVQAGLLAAAKAPPPPPRKPAGEACEVDLYAQMSGGSWGAPVGDSVITFPRMASVQLRAEGKPAGGSYSWTYDYSTPDLAADVQASNTFFQPSGPTARWMSASRRTVVVTVTYKCPPGTTPAMVTDTITLRVR